VVVGAVVAILRLVLPTVLGWLGIAGDVVGRVVMIILTAVAIIFVLYLLYDLVTCIGYPRIR
jgi:hypothetical protein